tara:strand:- start:3157 stop:3486 length:330 start_codon:yes stop_codon:yes gene_type:complete
MVAAGKLREIVRIENPTITLNAVGQAEYSYLSLGAPEVFAQVEYTSQNKTSDGEVQNAGQANFLVTMRYRTDITYRTRLVWGARVLQVVGIESDPKKVVSMLECEEADQ